MNAELPVEIQISQVAVTPEVNAIKGWVYNGSYYRLKKTGYRLTLGKESSWVIYPAILVSNSTTSCMLPETQHLTASLVNAINGGSRRSVVEFEGDYVRRQYYYREGDLSALSGGIGATDLQTGASWNNVFAWPANILSSIKSSDFVHGIISPGCSGEAVYRIKTELNVIVYDRNNNTDFSSTFVTNYDIRMKFANGYNVYPTYLTCKGAVASEMLCGKFSIRNASGISNETNESIFVHMTTPTTNNIIVQFLGGGGIEKKNLSTPSVDILRTGDYSVRVQNPKKETGVFTYPLNISLSFN